jgi:hypothetical protein
MMEGRWHTPLPIFSGSRNRAALGLALSKFPSVLGHEDICQSPPRAIAAGFFMMTHGITPTPSELRASGPYAQVADSAGACARVVDSAAAFATEAKTSRSVCGSRSDCPCACKAARRGPFHPCSVGSFWYVGRPRERRSLGRRSHRESYRAYLSFQAQSLFQSDGAGQFRHR